MVRQSLFPFPPWATAISRFLIRILRISSPSALLLKVKLRFPFSRYRIAFSSFPRFFSHVLLVAPCCLHSCSDQISASSSAVSCFMGVLVKIPSAQVDSSSFWYLPSPLSIFFLLPAPLSLSASPGRRYLFLFLCPLVFWRLPLVFLLYSGKKN